MEQLVSFGEVLESIEKLSLDEQETLMDIVQRRIAERSRKAPRAETQKAHQEFTKGECQPATADELMKGILS